MTCTWPPAEQPTDQTTAVITLAKGRRDHLARQTAALARSGFDGHHVIVDMGGAPIDPLASLASGTTVVDLPVADGTPLPLALARNTGATVAGADRLIFLDVDCIPSATLVSGYESALSAVDGIVAGPVAYLPESCSITDWTDTTLQQIGRVQHGRPMFDQPRARTDRYDLFWSLSFALSAADFNRIGGFDERYVGYGGEDTDFARTAEQRSIPFWFDGAPGAYHQHHPVSSPPVEHLADIVDNAQTFFDKWGSWPMRGWLEAFVDLDLVTWNEREDELRIKATAVSGEQRRRG